MTQQAKNMLSIKLVIPTCPLITPTFGLMGGALVETCALLWPATDAKYWMTFFVFSVFPAPLSPLENTHHTAMLLRTWKCICGGFIFGTKNGVITRCL